MHAVSLAALEMSRLRNTAGDARDFAFEYSQAEAQPLQPYRTRVQADLERVARRGGRCNFLEHPSYVAGSVLVLVLNMVVVTLEVTVPEIREECQWLDQALLSLYIVELGCRIGHLGCRSFLTEQERTCNLLDVVNVSVGLLQIFVLPFVLPPAHLRYVGLLSYLRLIRALRLFKNSSFGWTGDDWFQYLSGGVICLNAAVLGFETDSPAPAWWWVNQGILLFFVFEIVVRVRLEGCKHFFTSEEDFFWNWMDFVIVLLGVVDLWAVPIASLVFSVNMTSGFGRLVLLVRMLRMLRILRLLKLVKAVRPLYSLALGVTQAMQSIFWVLVFLVVTLYAFAILATRLLGHSKHIQDDPDLPAPSKDLFRSIWDSLFALFSIMNQQNWESIAPLLEKIPAIKPVYVLFTICSSWALLSVLTGVVSENMMAVRESQAQKDEEAVEERRIWLARWLRGVFAAADKDGSMTLERSEYRELLKSPFHLKRLQQVAKVPMQDLMQMFDILDVDGNGLIEFQEFLIGFEWLNEPISGKSLLKLGHEIRVSCQLVEKLLANLSEELNQVCSRQLANQHNLEEKLRQVLEARKKMKEEYEKTLVAQADAIASRTELRRAIGAYKDSTFSEDGDVVIQTPDPSSKKDEVIQTPDASTKKENLRRVQEETEAYGSSYRMMEEDESKPASPSGAEKAAALRTGMARSQSMQPF
ncbi:unnamed protein product [Effrenium voratum]|nr:unnamed protein product [Effrenium voratum]